MPDASTVRIGDLDLIPINDGLCKLSTEFYVGLDFATHQEMLSDDGKVHIPIGCFLLRTRGLTVLVDGDSAMSTSAGRAEEIFLRGCGLLV